MPEALERLEVVDRLLVPAGEVDQPVAGVEVDEEDHAGVLRLADDVLERRRCPRARRPRAPRPGSRRRGRSRSGRRRCRCPAQPVAGPACGAHLVQDGRRCRAESPLTFTATGMSEPSLELKTASGSMSLPTERARDSPASVSASSGRSSPDPSLSCFISSSALVASPLPAAIWSTRSVNQPSSKPTPNAAAVSAGRVASTSSPAVGSPGAAPRSRPGRRPTSSSRAPSSKRSVAAAPLKSLSAVARSRRGRCRRPPPSIAPTFAEVVGEVLPGGGRGVQVHDAGVADLVAPALVVLVVGEGRLGRVVGDGGGELVGLGDHRPAVLDGPAADGRSAPAASVAQLRILVRPASALSASVTWSTRTGVGTSAPVSTAATAARSPIHGSMSTR